jgi:hypothetical protein
VNAGLDLIAAPFFPFFLDNFVSWAKIESGERVRIGGQGVVRAAFFTPSWETTPRMHFRCASSPSKGVVLYLVSFACMRVNFWDFFRRQRWNNRATTGSYQPLGMTRRFFVLDASVWIVFSCNSSAGVIVSLNWFHKGLIIFRPFTHSPKKIQSPSQTKQRILGGGAPVWTATKLKRVRLREIAIFSPAAAAVLQI